MLKLILTQLELSHSCFVKIYKMNLFLYLQLLKHLLEVLVCTEKFHYF